MKSILESFPSFLNLLGHYLSNFVLWLIDHEKILPKRESDSSGGVTVLGWSMGTVSVASFLSSENGLSVKARTKLAKYLKGIIFYGNISTKQLMDLV